MSEVELHLGDCLEFMREMPDKSVDAVITDPPYNIGFGYDEYSDLLPDEEYIDLIASLRHFDKLSIIQYPELAFKYFYPSLGVPEKVSAWCYNSNAPRRFRLICHYGFSPDYSQVRQPYKNPGDRRIREMGDPSGTAIYEWWDDIQQVKNVSAEKTEHPCPIPLKLAERLVLITTKPGDTVFDPFMGSGTVGEACIKHDRKFIGAELSPDYFDIAANRITEAQLQMRMPL